MGTRGFIGFVADGVEKIAYNQFDSYPDGVGATVLDFLWANRHELTCTRHSSVSGSAPDLIRKLRVVGENSTPTAEDVERLSQYADLRVGTRDPREWYVLLRETQGNPALMLQAGVIEDASGFPLDSLFCEWGYLVDMDAKTFEVYRGFQRSPHGKGRFASRGEGRAAPLGNEYHPVALAQSWPLDKLPTHDEFLAALNEDE